MFGGITIRLMSKDGAVVMSHVGLLNLDWVNEASCCKEETIWANLLLVESVEEMIGIDTLDVLGKLWDTKGMLEEVWSIVEVGRGGLEYVTRRKSEIRETQRW